MPLVLRKFGYCYKAYNGNLIGYDLLLELEHDDMDDVHFFELGRNLEIWLGGTRNAGGDFSQAEKSDESWSHEIGDF